MADDVAINFVSRSILHTHQFSWIFLVDWLLVLALSVFSLFYFNQLLGLLFTHTFGWYLWHRYGVYLKVQSIQISLLGGRVIFRNVIYIGTSQAVRIVHGTLSWRYWMYRRRKAAFKMHEQDGGYPERSKDGGDHADHEKSGEFNPMGSSGLPLNLKVVGVEWFVYNREYAYDSLAKSEPALAELAREFDQLQHGLSFFERRLVELLPLRVEVHTLGAIFGNDDTESLIVLSSQRVNCVVDMAAASTPADRYMNMVDARLTKAKIELKDNIDYQVSSIMPEKQQRNFSRRRRRHKWMRRLLKRAENEPNKPWFGLKRYVDPEGNENTGSDVDLGVNAKTAEKGNNNNNNSAGDDTPAESPEIPSTGEVLSHLAALPTEYAKVSQLLACDSVDLQFKADVVGPAHPQSESESELSSGEEKVEWPSPIFDTNLVLYGAKINYGPHAERQRQEFFRMFFPQDYNPSPLPTSGTYNGLRVHTHGTVSISLKDETLLMVPVREKSKDEAFAQHIVKSLQSMGGEIQRSYGWIEVRAAEGSKVNIVVPFVPETDPKNDQMGAYSTKCLVDLQSPTVRTSVNHDTYYTAKKTEFSAVQYQPNVFNTPTTYDLNIKSDDMVVFLLREHVTLVSDAALDFSTGPPVPYMLFQPAVYNVSWTITNFSLNLNVNKGNIINKPCSLSENTFLILKTPELNVQWEVPRLEIAPPSSDIVYKITAPYLDMDLSAPNWHTMQGFLDSHHMATVQNFCVDVKDTRTTLSVSEHDNDAQFETDLARFVDTLVMDVRGDNFMLKAHGFLIEYVMRIRENYFGHAYHFQTKEEFVDKMNQEMNEKKENDTYAFKRADVDTDAIVNIHVSKGSLLLPQRLFSAKDCIALQYMEMNVDMRFTNYYMDLQVEIAPLMGRHLTGINPGTAFDEAMSASLSNADMSISSLEVHAHRMFGLPPVEPTYAVRWDFEIGDITADLHPSFLQAFGDVSMVFGQSIQDDENKPVMPPEELNDVTFLSLTVSSIDITVRPLLPIASPSYEQYEGARFQIATSTIKVRFNDLANERFSGRSSVEIPYIRIRAFNKVNKIDTLVMEAVTAIMMTNYVQKPFRLEFYKKQQNHIALHDHLFKRSEFLLARETKTRYPYTRSHQPDDLRPCIPLPVLPPPITRDNLEALSGELFFPTSRRGSAWSSEASKNTSLRSLVDVEDDGRDSFASSPWEDSTSDDENDESHLPTYAKKARARHAGPSPDVYPFSSQSMSAERNNIRNTKTTFEFKPGPWFAGDLNVETIDDNMEHDNVLVLIKPITAQLTPNFITVVDAFGMEKEDIDFEMQLDRLQIMILHGLVREKAPIPSRKLFLTAPSLDLRFSDEISCNYSGVRFMVEDMDLKVHFLKEKLQGLHADFDNLSLSLRQGFTGPMDAKLNAAALILSKFSFLWQQVSDESSVGSLSLNGIDVSFAADQIEWSFDYVTRLLEALTAARVSPHGSSSSSSSSSRSASRHNDLKATFYALTMAGETMGLEEESNVLSKPSGTIQAHVRGEVSWRIVMRLRYLLQSIPPMERKKMETSVLRGDSLPYDAKEQMLAIYRNWRSWEQSKNLENSEIFKQVFNDLSFQEYVLSLTIRMALRIDSMVARIIYPDTHDHFAGLDSLDVILSSTQKNKVQNLGISVQCAKIRAKGSMDLIAVSASFIRSLNEMERRLKNRQKVSRKPIYVANDRESQSPTAEDKKEEDKKEADVAKNSSSAFQANISVFLLDLILEFDLERIHIETQNHQIQFTSAVELMESKNLASLFHLGTLVITDGAFRIYRSSHGRQQQHDDVFDALAQGVQAGYASRGLGVERKTWTSFNLDAVSFMSHLKANDLALLLVDFIEVELPAIQRAVEVLKDSSLDQDSESEVIDSKRTLRSDSVRSDSASRVTHASTIGDDEVEKEEDVMSGEFLNISIGSVKLKTQLVDELRFVWLAKTLTCKIRSMGGDVVSSFSVERSTIGIHFSDAYEAVANMQFDTVRSLVKFDSQAPELIVYTNADAIRLGTMSIVWLLEYSKHHHLDERIHEVIETLNRAVDLLQVDKSQNQNPPHEPSSDSKLSFRIKNHIDELSIRLPLDSSSFLLTVDGVYSHFGNAKNSIDEPQSISCGIQDMKLELLSTAQKPREMVKLQFDMSAQRSKGRILLSFASEFMKFGLDPESVGAILIATEKIKSHSRDLFRVKDSKDATVLTGSEPDNKESTKVSDLANVRVKLLSKDTTFTWYTDPNSTQGIIFGYEKLQLKFARLIANLELASAYISPVTEASKNIPAKDRYNSVYLPLMKASMLMDQPVDDKKPRINISVTGEAVSMTLIPSVAPWILALSDSATKTSETLANVLEKFDSSSSSRSGSIPSEDSEEDNDDDAARAETLTLPFDVSVDTNIDSSVLRFFDEGGRKNEPSLELYSPSIHVIFGFENQRLLLRIDASKTSNTVYPRAIPEVKAISSLISEGFKQRSRGKRGTERKRSINRPSSSWQQLQPQVSSSSWNGKEDIKASINSPVKGIEVDFQFHLEPQHLYLSCLPYGKVGASLSTEGMDLLVMTPNLSCSDIPTESQMESSESMLTVYGMLKRTGMSMQHIYSSEISGVIEFSQFAVLGMLSKNKPMKFVANLIDPRFDMQLSKLHDMRVFFDIWALYENPVKAEASPEPIPQTTQLRRKYSTSSGSSRPTFSPTSPQLGSHLSAVSDDEDARDEEEAEAEQIHLFERYKSAIAAVPTSVIGNLNVINLRVNMGLGPSIGDVKIHNDRFWVAMLQTTSMEQIINVGLSSFAATFEGRLGGTFRLDGLIAKTAMKWKDNQSHPLMHAKLKFKKVGFYFSLDFHPFISGVVNDLATILTTQDSDDVEEDRVNVAVTCRSVSILVTALVVVHSLDVISLFKRLMSQISSAPHFMLPELTEETAARNETRQAQRSRRIAAHQQQFKAIRVLLDIQLGSFCAHAFPTEFADNVALKVFAQRVEVHYDRTHYENRWESSMDLAVDESNIGLANIRGGGYKKTLTDLDYEGLIDFVTRSSSGGTIVNTPEVTIVLDTWQYMNDPNVVYYTFTNKVSGTIDVGWNLGSVNFIKEMMNTHKDAWATRQEFYETSMQYIDDGHRSAQAYREAAANLERKNSQRASAPSDTTSSSGGSASDTTSKAAETVATAAEAVTDAVSNVLSPTEPDEESASAYAPNLHLMGIRYVAREAPVVLIPQLRDLGDATPPIEWLGVNRERIPLFIHGFIMKKLGLSADEIEKIYLEVVGRMD